MSPELTWYVARAAGLVAWALATAAVVWGLALSTRITGGRPPAAWLASLHRFIGGLAVVFSGVHVVALLADDWVQFTVADVLVPLASTWRPAAIAWGVVALYLLVAVELTSLLRRHVGLRWWRLIHQTSVPLFAAGTVHMLAAGTDARTLWVRATVLIGLLAVVFLSAVRVLAPRRPTGRTAARVATAAAAQGSVRRGRPGTHDPRGDVGERVRRVQPDHGRAVHGVDAPGQ